ncbi:putative short-chain dehydrogenase [Massariosphaeria phaeospora]|uniref:Putative short-chain dehydrogenase n=1 Tax=Massariosphaeria phaeospora TaxID=100035 RepID=A0A7C8I2D9_9PLEO|nr:putative short-chain dehydrogenase [Massariosphaeria phaeospora]
MAGPPYKREDTASKIAAEHASSIAGKVVLTTGVSPGGLGATFVETIAAHNPKLLILAGRNPSKVQATADAIKTANPNVATRILILDLGSQAQIREAAKEVLTYAEPIDVLVNSAGVMACNWQTTEEGIEYQFGMNHIGHFLFTNLIMPKVLAAKNPRVVSVSSEGHGLGRPSFDDWNFQNGSTYNRWEAYGRSKAANVLFAKALAQKLGGKGLRAYSLHPGVAFGTTLSAGIAEAEFQELAELVSQQGSKVDVDFKTKTLDECSSSHVVAAFDPRLEDYNGSYLDDGHVADDALESTATHPEDVEKLWKLSEKLVDQEFNY